MLSTASRELRFSWLISIVEFLPKPMKIDLPYFSDYTDIFLSSILIPIGMGLMYHIWSKIPLIAQYVYENKIIVLPEEEYVLILKKHQRLYSSIIAQVVLTLLAGVLTMLLYTSCIPATEHLWWANAGPVFLSFYYIITTWLILYYIVTNIFKGFVTMKLTVEVFKRKLNLLLFHPDGCSGLKPIGQPIFWGYYCCMLVGVGFLSFYVFGYVRGTDFLVSLAIYLLFALLFIILPMYIVHKKMKFCKDEMLKKIYGVLDNRCNYIRDKIESMSLDVESISKIQGFTALEHLYSRVLKVRTWPFVVEASLFAILIYVMQVVALILQFQKATS